MSRQIGVSVPDELYATLEAEHAKRKESDPEASFSAVVRGMIEAGMAAPAPAEYVGMAPNITLDEAAEILLKELPEAMVDLVRQICLDNGQRPARYLLSYAQLAHERGETAYIISGDDLAPLKAIPPFQAAGTTACEYCRKPFVPIRQGQKFCPPPDEDSPGCGRLAAEAEWHAKRPHDLDAQRRIARQHGFLPGGAQPQPATPSAEVIAQAVALALKQMGVTKPG